MLLKQDAMIEGTRIFKRRTLANVLQMHHAAYLCTSFETVPLLLLGKVISNTCLPLSWQE